MKRLFILKDLKGKPYVVGKFIAYFPSKIKAKEMRDLLNEQSCTYHISRGPDHMSRHGNIHKLRSNKRTP